MMADLANRRRATEYRERVALGLQSLGVEATPVALPNRPSEAFSGPSGHVLVPTVPGVTVTVSSGFEFRPSELLNAAERAAANDQNDIGALVQFRQVSTVEQQYVLLSLKSFAALLRDRLKARS